MLICNVPGKYGGEGGIRTHDRLLTYTHFPGVLLKPLGHLSGDCVPVGAGPLRLDDVHASR